MMRVWLFPVVLALALVPLLVRPGSALAQQALRIELTREIVTKVTGNLATLQDAPVMRPSPPAGKTTQRQTVMIYPSGFSVSADDIETVYDFAARKIMVLDHKNKTAQTISTASVPLTRDRERALRIDIGERAREQAKNGGQTPQLYPVTTFDLDMIFGTEKGSKHTEDLLQFTEQEGRRFFSAEGKPLAIYQSSPMDVPVELRPSYKKYLLYAHTMHPALRQQLLNDGKVMAELRYQNTDIDVSQMFAHSDISARLGTETLPALPAGYTVVPAAGVDGIPDAPAADEAAAPQNFPEYF